MADTKIEWCEKSWNPIAGCTKCSPGCENCYAERMAYRLACMEATEIDRVMQGEIRPDRLVKYLPIVDLTKKQWNGKVHCFQRELDIPFHWRKPSRIFVCSMSDLFHLKVPFEFIDKVFKTMIESPRHTYLILTKRPQRMAEWVKDYAEIYNRFFGKRSTFESIGNTVHIGVSISNQAEADEKIPILLQIPAAVRWLSIEPMLGPIDLTRIGGDQFGWGRIDTILGLHYIRANALEEGSEWETRKVNKIDWVVVGGESGPGARPMHPDWVRSIRDQCVNAGVPFFFKQWGEWEIANKENAARHGYVVTGSRQGFLTPYNSKKFVSLNKDGSHYRDNPQPNSIAMAHVGKKMAGCLLDGKEWKQYPERS